MDARAIEGAIYDLELLMVIALVVVLVLYLRPRGPWHSIGTRLVAGIEEGNALKRQERAEHAELLAEMKSNSRMVQSVEAGVHGLRRMLRDVLHRGERPSSRRGERAATYPPPSWRDSRGDDDG